MIDFVALATIVRMHKDLIGHTTFTVVEDKAKRAHKKPGPNKGDKDIDEPEVPERFHVHFGRPVGYPVTGDMTEDLANAERDRFEAEYAEDFRRQLEAITKARILAALG